LLDRIDIHIEVPSLKYDELKSTQIAESSAMIRERVNNARTLQLKRYENKKKKIYCNAHLGSKDIRTHCRIDEQSQTLLKTAIERFGLSARAYDKVLKVARTIADLQGLEHMKVEHVAEAIQYRSLDKNVWQKL
jgi:magnesium chelatase family protein